MERNEIIFYDELDERAHYFFSDATQALVDGLKFLLEWHVVKNQLEAWGHYVLELNESSN